MQGLQPWSPRCATQYGTPCLWGEGISGLARPSLAQKLPFIIPVGTPSPSLRCPCRGCCCCGLFTGRAANHRIAPGTFPRFLAMDYSIDCDGGAYRHVQWMSVVFMVAYGVGIPMAFNVTGAFLRHLDAATERSTFQFLFAGYKRCVGVAPPPPPPPSAGVVQARRGWATLPPAAVAGLKVEPFAKYLGVLLGKVSGDYGRLAPERGGGTPPSPPPPFGVTVSPASCFCPLPMALSTDLYPPDVASLPLP